MNEFFEHNRIIRAIRSFRSSLRIEDTFESQMEIIKKMLRNDNTGLIVPIMDFHIQAATTTFSIETDNESLNTVLSLWQKEYLNKDVANDIPRGLHQLTSEHMRERLTSSVIVLRVLWEKIDFGGNLGEWIIPYRMWLMDGSTIKMGPATSDLAAHKYYVRDGTKYGTKELIAGLNESIIIRKPFSAYYDMCPVPYMVRRGVAWNGLFKQLILEKQSTSMEQLIPYLLLMTAGSQKLAEAGVQTTEAELISFKNSLLQAIKDHDYTGEIGKLIAAINGDVKMEHFLPELLKLTDSKITEACDTNILSGMGLIEITGFSNTRKEAIMNPQVFVTDVCDSVMDWALILEEVMYQMKEKNKELHPTLTNKAISVIPGTIKTFLTDKMKSIMGLARDKGVLPEEDYLNDVFNKQLSDVMKRRKKEKADGVDTTLTPRQTQVFPPKETPAANDDPSGKKEEQGKKPNTPESRNFKADSVKLEAPYSNIDELPDSIKENLPHAAQIIWLKTFNSVIEEGKDEESAIKIAWSKVKEKYTKKDDKWVKK